MEHFHVRKDTVVASDVLVSLYIVLPVVAHDTIKLALRAYGDARNVHFAIAIVETQWYLSTLYLRIDCKTLRLHSPTVGKCAR